MIDIKKLNKSYGQNHVLKDVNLCVGEGQVVSIIGPSGTGKSTLLRSINYLEEPESGTITINNQTYDYSNMSSKDVIELRKQSCMVFQNYNLFRNKTALGNVTESLKVVRKMDAQKANDIGEKYLDLVGLIDKKDSFPRSLSGGQQQRVGIARALAVNPKVLLFDEPTSSLDPELVNEVLNVIGKLVEETNITMLIVTHEMDFASKISDKVVFMSEGTILEEGTPEEIIVHPQNKRIKDFMGQATH